MITFFSSLTSAELVYIIVILAYIPMMIIGLVINSRVSSTFNKYSTVVAHNGLSAAQVARKMLDDNGLQHIAITQINGTLTDNYNPKLGVVSLSSSVYSSTSVAAVAVACHECGHAVQHAENYMFSSLRLTLVPVLNFASKLIMPLIIIGILFQFLLVAFSGFAFMFLISGVVLYGLYLLFSLVTLPTEFDASARAKKYLSQFMSRDEVDGSSKVLRAAAMTYVVAALISLMQFLYYAARLAMLLSRNRD